MAAALQWNVASAYIIAPIATNVNSPALMRPTRSPKFNSPIARLPRITVKLSHERKVLSLAKNTCYTNTTSDHVRDENGKLSGVSVPYLWLDTGGKGNALSGGTLEEGLGRHGAFSCE